MSSTHQMKVLLSVWVLIVAVAVIGYLVLQKLDSIARMTECSATSSRPQKPSVMPSGTARIKRPFVDPDGNPPPPNTLSTNCADVGAFHRQNAEMPASRMPARQASRTRKRSESLKGDHAANSLRHSSSLQGSWGGLEVLHVPVGTHLLSSQKPVSSIDDFPIIGELFYVTDGDKKASEGSFVELGSDLQYVQIDLESVCSVYAIALWHYYADTRVYHDVAVLLSTTNTFSTFDIIYNNDSDNSLGLGDPMNEEYAETPGGLLQEVGGIKARYVRCYSNGNTMNDQNHYIEVEVYGLAVESK